MVALMTAIWVRLSRVIFTLWHWLTRAPAHAVEDIFKLENIPTASPKAAAELKAIKETHVYNPLPAYDIDGSVIKPKDYRAKLRGATVIMTFGLKHYFIGPRSEGVAGNNTFVADILKIRWLRRLGLARFLP